MIVVFLSDIYEKKGKEYSCIFFQSEKNNGLNYYLFASEVNGVDYNAALGGSVVIPKGVQSIAIPSNSKSNIKVRFIGVRDGYGWSTSKEFLISDFLVNEGENYFVKMTLIDKFNAHIWVEAVSSGKVVYGKKI
ncbi:hypothetical protein AB835_10510 [Candidatus Endobugula sertula]|uniref:Uncharacterized protein n=1 Tax=Candidatus Endobugula sertula TaxID=62101 RepID=A0A1D2QNL8_9GAMM|nr:hypothetical protein AB835_10510 [Candidatus Endobugula sertula]